MGRTRKPNRINPTLTTISDRNPYAPEHRTIVGPDGAIAISWNPQGAWLELRADSVLADGDLFAGALMTPADAEDLAGTLRKVSWLMDHITPVRYVGTPGRFHGVQEACEGLVTVGVTRTEAVLVSGWFRTCGKPMSANNLRAMARQLTDWAAREEAAQ